MRLRGIITLGLAAALCACDLALDLSAFEANTDAGAGGHAGGSDALAAGGAAGGDDAFCPQELPAGAETWLCTEEPRLLSGHGETLYWLGGAAEALHLRKARLDEDSVTELGSIDKACGLVARAETVFVRTNAGQVLALSAQDGEPLNEQSGYGQNCALAADDERVVWFDAEGGQLRESNAQLSGSSVVQANVTGVRSLALSASGVLWVGRLAGERTPTFHLTKGNETLQLVTSDEPCAVAFDGNNALISTTNGLLRWDPELPQSPLDPLLHDSRDALCRLDANSSHLVVAARNKALLHIVPLAGQQLDPLQLEPGGLLVADVALVGDSVVWAPRPWGGLVRYVLP